MDHLIRSRGLNGNYGSTQAVTSTSHGVSPYGQPNIGAGFGFSPQASSHTNEGPSNQRKGLLPMYSPVTGPHADLVVPDAYTSTHMFNGPAGINYAPLVQNQGGLGQFTPPSWTGSFQQMHPSRFSNLQPSAGHTVSQPPQTASGGSASAARNAKRARRRRNNKAIIGPQAWTIENAPPLLYPLVNNEPQYSVGVTQWTDDSIKWFFLDSLTHTKKLGETIEGISLQIRTSGSDHIKKWLLAEPHDESQKDHPGTHDKCLKAQEMLKAYVKRIQSLMGTENVTVPSGPVQGLRVSLLAFYAIYKQGKSSAFLSQEQTPSSPRQSWTQDGLFYALESSSSSRGEEIIQPKLQAHVLEVGTAKAFRVLSGDEIQGRSVYTAEPVPDVQIKEENGFQRPEKDSSANLKSPRKDEDMVKLAEFCPDMDPKQVKGESEFDALEDGTYMRPAKTQRVDIKPEI